MLAGLGFLIFPIMMILNFAISWWNATAVGRIWSESKKVGGFMRVNAVAGYVMAIAGFTMVYGMILLFISPFILPMISEQFTQAEVQQQVMMLAGDLLYVFMTLTIIPAGFIIWFQSVKGFWQRKTIRGGLVAGWNTFAMISNSINAVRHLPGAIGRIKNAFSDQRGNGMIILVAVIIVLAAILGGYFTASAIMKRADGKYDYFEAMKAKYDQNPQKYEKLAS